MSLKRIILWNRHREKVGKPVFNEGSQTFEADKIRYNFKTKKGIVSGVITQQGEGFVHGERVKVNEKNESFIDDALYTTCNLPDPHFRIRARKIKMIPEKRVITGPFNLVINDVPTPIGFAFGMFPIPKEKASGVIIPKYGESSDRGFFLRDGGLLLGTWRLYGTQISRRNLYQWILGYPV